MTLSSWVEGLMMDWVTYFGSLKMIVSVDTEVRSRLAETERELGSEPETTVFGSCFFSVKKANFTTRF